MFQTRQCHVRATSLGAFALAVVAFMPLGALKAEPAAAGEKYALLVGVHQYDKTELHDLPYAESDVEALAEVLRKAGYKRVILMTQTVGAKQSRFLPLAANIRKTLKGMLEDHAGGDSVIVAFAGHGVQFKGEDENYFCPMDAKLEDKSTLISLSDVYKDMAASEAGMRLLLVDACRNDPRSDESRAVSRIKLESVTRPQKALPPGGVAAFFSCSAGEKAYENTNLKHGVFFHFLIEGLKGKADKDANGQVYLDDLVRYTTRQVPDFVKETYGDGVRQMPELVGTTRGLVSLAKVASVDRSDATTTEEKKTETGGNRENVRIRTGRRIFGRWSYDGYWYAAVVKEIKGDKYLAHFDDDQEKWLEEGDVTVYLPMIGDHIEGNWLGKGKYYKGTVTERRGKFIHINYDDGDEENTTMSFLRGDFDGIVLP